MDLGDAVIFTLWFFAVIAAACAIGYAVGRWLLAPVADALMSVMGFLVGGRRSG
jgi:hypothetical protein